MKKLSSSFTYLTIECEIMIKNKINKCSIDTHEKAMINQSLLSHISYVNSLIG